jgi:hypothetical protein
MMGIRNNSAYKKSKHQVEIRMIAKIVNGTNVNKIKRKIRANIGVVPAYRRT